MKRSIAVLLACLLVFTFLIAVDATSVIFTVNIITASLDGDATESFWIGAAYLLAMCVSQPMFSKCSNVSGRKSIILASAMLLGVGSLISEDSKSMVFLLLGRTTQGLGAGGLTALSYVVYDDLGHLDSDADERDTKQAATKFLTAISCSVALGTVCGPLIGAVLSHGSDWRWLFRLNLPFCFILGVLVYSTDDTLPRDIHSAAKFSDIDFIAASLSVTSLIPLLVGLSFAGSRYEWNDWRTLGPISVGCACLLLFTVWELRLCRTWLPLRKYRDSVLPFLGLNSFKTPQAVNTVIGAVVLGVLMYTLLFFLPIYYRVVKEHSAIATSLLLLPQTLMIAPCGAAVFVCIEKVKLPPHRMILFGWICTACGFGLLSLLNAGRTVAFDVLFNLVSGIGIGVLLPALTLGAKDSTDDEYATQASMVLVYMRYVGSASGLIATGLAFQRLLRRNLATTKFQGEAAELTKHATMLMFSINGMADSEDKHTLIQAVQAALCTIWIALSIICAVMFLLNCTSTFAAADRTKSAPSRRSTTVSETPSNLPAMPTRAATGRPPHPSDDPTRDLELDSSTARAGIIDKDHKGI